MDTNLKKYEILTGDIFLSASWHLPSTLIEFGMSSKWSHVGIFIWLDDKKITLNKGELFILEVAGRPGRDHLTGMKDRSCRVSHISKMYDHTKRFAVRKIDFDRYKDKDFLDRFVKFTDSAIKCNWKMSAWRPSLPFLNYDFYGQEYDPIKFGKSIQCGEFVAYYFNHVIDSKSIEYPAYTSPTEFGQDRSLDHLFIGPEEIIYIADTSWTWPSYHAVIALFIIILIIALIIIYYSCKKKKYL